MQHSAQTVQEPRRWPCVWHRFVWQYGESTDLLHFSAQRNRNAIRDQNTRSDENFVDLLSPVDNGYRASQWR